MRQDASSCAGLTVFSTWSSSRRKCKPQTSVRHPLYWQPWDEILALRSTRQSICCDQRFSQLFLIRAAKSKNTCKAVSQCLECFRFQCGSLEPCRCSDNFEQFAIHSMISILVFNFLFFFAQNTTFCECIVLFIFSKIYVNTSAITNHSSLFKCQMLQ